MSRLFSPVTLRGLTVRNRVWLSPMCMYSCVDGLPNDWHLVHLGGRAAGGTGLVFTEANAVSPEGRISPQDAGIWTDEQAERWRRVVDFVHRQGAAAGMQLAHAGRKASVFPPGAERSGSVPLAEGGWPTVGPSPVAFGRYAVPAELDQAGIEKVRADFVAAARRADAAGFDLVELHAAHGYLLHSFLSPLANSRADGYGTDRARLLLEVVRDVRAVWPEAKPLAVRISATDWVSGGWDLDDSVALAVRLKAEGVDLVDCSSGGLHPDQQIVLGPGYQVPFAAAVRQRAEVATAAVGLITSPAQAEQVLMEGAADVVLLGRELLRQPGWPLSAARDLGDPEAGQWPVQYLRARPAS